MRKLSLFLCLLVAALTVSGQDYSQYYKDVPFRMSPVVQPKFPDRSVNLTDFGAVGNGSVSNTKAFAAAMDALAAQGGGTLVVPRGIWLTGPIHFKSNVNLHVSDGALILFTPDYDEYPLIETNYEGWKAMKATSPIMAHNVTNIAITGGGVIDGNGDNWRPVKREKMTPGQWNNLKKRGGAVDPQGRLWFPAGGAMKGYIDPTKYTEMSRERQEEYKVFFRPVMVSIVGSKNILLQGVTFQNSPAWNIHPLMCENLTVDGVIVRNPWYSQNGDGIDIESCSNVLVVNSSFDVGDDAICIKSGKDKEGRDRAMPTRNLIVDNCIVYHGHGGFVVGSEMSGGANNLLVRNCTFMGTDVGLRFKSRRGRGGVVENIWIENIDMTNIPGQALLFDLYYGKRDPNAAVPPVNEETPSFRNFTIKNITCRGAGTAMLFNGLPEMNVKNMTVDGAFMQTTKGVVINDSDGITLKNCTVVASEGPTVTVYNAKNVDAKGLSTGAGKVVTVAESGSNANLSFAPGAKIEAKK